MIINEKELTGYPSIDKPWLKYYSEEAINTPLPEYTIYEYLLENNKDYLDDIAIIYFNRKITYKQLFDAIDRAASVFSSFGVAKGDIVMICTLNTPEMIYCAYALNKIGAIADFEYPTLSEDELYSTIKALNAKAVVMLDLFRKKYKDITNHTQNCLFISPCSSFSFTMKAVYKLKRKNVIDTLTPLIKNAKADNIAQDHKHDQPAIIVHTGGSTGVPKGVLLNDDSFNAIAFQYKLSGMEYKRQDRILHCIPPFHAYGFSVGVHMPLSLGMTICMSIKIDNETMVELFSKYKPAHFVGGGSHVSAIIKDRRIIKSDLSHLKTIAIGGAAISESFEIEANDFLISHNAKSKLIVGYGMTETCATVCTNMDKCSKVGTVGIPLPKVSIKIIDVDSGKELGYNETGELYISSPSLMMKYYSNDEETSNTLLNDHSGIWVKSGDVASVDEDGFVTIKGRIKRIYATKDLETGYIFKIYPTYIENTILKCKSIDSCAVICKKDKKHIHIAEAFIKLSKDCNANASITEIKNICLQHLPPYSQPVKYHVIESIPMTPVGKTDYEQLEKMSEE